MKIGLMTDGLADLGIAELLAAAERLGLEALEFSTGNWGAAPHLPLERLLESEAERRDFTARLAQHGLAISALNCSGNQLAPGDVGERHRRTVRETIELAGLLGVDRVVLMSGLPAAPGDRHPNWIVVAWPPETAAVLSQQWEGSALPYWRELVAFAQEHGVGRLCIEPHGHQLVYNPETLLRLRDAVGDVVGANFDPSHLLWMGGDPLAAVDELAGAIYHVHAKDTRIESANRGPNTLLETKANDRVADRSWNYVTLGEGHAEPFWRSLVARLRAVGYDDVLSIEHEDRSMSPAEGVRRSVELLRRVLDRSEEQDAAGEHSL